MIDSFIALFFPLFHVKLNSFVTTNGKDPQIDSLLRRHDIDDDRSIIESSLREVVVKQ